MLGFSQWSQKSILNFEGFLRTTLKDSTDFFVYAQLLTYNMNTLESSNHMHANSMPTIFIASYISKLI